MRTQIFNTFKITALAIALSFGISYVYAWTAPTVVPTGGNVLAPINTSGTAQTKEGNFTAPNLINTSAITQTKTGGLNVATVSGDIGIGTTAPGAKLHVVASGTGGVVDFQDTKWGLLFSRSGSNLFGFHADGGVPAIYTHTGKLALMNGSVGIGTVTMPQTLTVAGAIGATGDICTTTGGVSKCLSTPAAAASPHGTAGPGSWIAPTGVTKVFVTAVGGGGGGGGSTTWYGACSGTGGGGGGAGAFAFKNLVSVTPGTTYTIVAGTAGTAGPAGTTNALGGTGGVSGISGVFTVAGGTGGNGPWSSGGCAGTAGTGGAGNSSTIYLGGIVAGPNGTPSDGTTSGGGAGVSIVGPDYGSGGKGTPPGTSASGTAGKPGFVLVEW